MMYAPLHSDGIAIDSDRRARVGALNVQTLETTFLAVLDLAVQTELDVIFLQECWISARSRRGVRHAARMANVGRWTARVRGRALRAC